MDSLDLSYIVERFDRIEEKLDFLLAALAEDAETEGLSVNLDGEQVHKFQEIDKPITGL